MVFLMPDSIKLLFLNEKVNEFVLKTYTKAIDCAPNDYFSQKKLLVLFPGYSTINLEQIK